ncbi:MAG TPA: type III-B CRISPR module RAMP protein Cmr1 [Streptosporangiaceae bacterium]|nr:type III-B CRISPR module RAMP protein Cmr1 [Streptosporangiaceae bacterium]
MTWTTLDLEVTTPLFNGGADPGGIAGFRPDQEAGVRVASVRGAMRFWFRALAGTLTGQNLRLLAALERRVFGGITDRRDGGEAALPSPLILRIPDPPRPSLDSSFLREKEGRWLGYLLGLGLMKPEKGGGARLLRPCVLPGADSSFHLKLRFAHDPQATGEVRQAIEALAFTSLWLACTYGGIGARTRRGFGGLRIVGASGELPRPWTPKGIQTPGLALYESTGWVWPWSGRIFAIFEQHLRQLIEAAREVSGPLDGWTGPPPFPVLSKRYSPAAVTTRRRDGTPPQNTPREFGSWQEALEYGGRQLRLFRGNRPFDETRRRQARVRTAEWDDVVNVIDRDSVDFPLGGFGLPVGYQDKLNDRKFTVNAVDLREPDQPELRRASPLWLRAVGSGTSWRLFTFVFQTRFLPGADDVSVCLLPGADAIEAGWRKDELTVRQADVEHLTGQWMTAMRGGGDFTTILRD